MIFAELPIEDCLGAILAHAQRSAEIAFKKGRQLSADDIAKLKQAGIRQLTVAKLEPGDVAEDSAAKALSEALASAGLYADAPFTGRANIYARHAGVLRVDAQHRRRDLDKVDIVGVFPNYASAYAAWKAKAQQTVDNAQMRYFIVHLHRLLDPDQDAKSGR